MDKLIVGVTGSGMSFCNKQELVSETFHISAKRTKENLCISKECEPPYGGKDNCEFNNNGICTAKSL